MDDLLREWKQTLVQHNVQLDNGSQVHKLGESAFKGHLLKLMQDVRGLMAMASKAGAPAGAGLQDNNKAPEPVADPLLSMPFLHALAVRDAIAAAAKEKVGENADANKPGTEADVAVVPNLLWMYWEQVPGEPQRPIYLEQCLERMRLWNAKNMQLHLVSPENLGRFVPGQEYQQKHVDTFIGMHAAFLRLATVQQRARYFSIWALYNFGGVWCDIDTIATGQLATLIDQQNTQQKQLTIWQRSFTREVDLSTMLVVPHHPVFKRWLQHLHQVMDVRANASLLEPIFLDPLKEIGASVLTELLWDYAWERRNFVYAYDVRPIAEIEPIDVFHSEAWGVSSAVDYAQWWQTMQREHPRSPYLLRFHHNQLPKSLQTMSLREFRQSNTCLAYMLQQMMQ